MGNAQKTLSSADTLARDIVRGLYEGQFTAGQRLVEPDLMERFGVSRSTVREAIQKLTAQGLVETHLNRGARIRELTLQQARNIVLILEQLLALAARQAAENIDAPGSREQLEAALAPFGTKAPPQDKFEFARMRNRFNRTLARIGGNDELAALLSNINAHMIGHRMNMAAEDKRQVYCRIGTAILEGNAALAERRVRAHLHGYLDLLAARYPES
ncbi:MAG: GntR family transcriptional regulator [Thalassovita sp.]